MIDFPYLGRMKSKTGGSYSGKFFNKNKAFGVFLSDEDKSKRCNVLIFQKKDDYPILLRFALCLKG